MSDFQNQISATCVFSRYLEVSDDGSSTNALGIVAGGMNIPPPPKDAGEGSIVIPQLGFLCIVIGPRKMAPDSVRFILRVQKRNSDMSFADIMPETTIDIDKSSIDGEKKSIEGGRDQFMFQLRGMIGPVPALPDGRVQAVIEIDGQQRVCGGIHFREMI